METTKLKNLYLSTDMMDASLISATFIHKDGTQDAGNILLGVGKSVFTNTDLLKLKTEAAKDPTDENGNAHIIYSTISSILDQATVKDLSGTNSVAIGGGFATGNNSLAVGYHERSTYSDRPFATGEGAVALGNLARATGRSAVALGSGAAVGNYSLALGGSTVTGNCSIGGLNCQVDGNYSAAFCNGGKIDSTVLFGFIEGRGNKLYNSEASHIEGYENVVCCNYAHAEGRNNIIYNGEESHIEGITNRINANTPANHIEGANNTISSTTNEFEMALNHIEGYNNNILTHGTRVHVEGSGNRIFESAAAHVEGADNTLSNNTGAHIAGTSNKITKENYGTVYGSNNTLSGNGGFNTIFGVNNNIGGSSNSFITGAECANTGSTSFIAGKNSSNSGDYSTVLGLNNSCIGSNSTVLGKAAKSLNIRSFVWNGVDSFTKDTPYTSKANGSFCINPDNNSSGFYIGANSLKSMLNNMIDKICLAANITDKTIIDNIKAQII